MHDKTKKIINHKMFALHSSSFRRELLVGKQTGLCNKFSSITFCPNYLNNSRASTSREQPVEM